MKLSDLGFDAFLNRGFNKEDKNVTTLSDIPSGFKSALQQNSQTESLSLGQAPMRVSDGRNLRIVIGKR